MLIFRCNYSLSMSIIYNDRNLSHSLFSSSRYWANQSKDPKKPPSKKVAAIRKAVSTVQPPRLTKDTRSKSMDVRASPDRVSLFSFLTLENTCDYTQ